MHDAVLPAAYVLKIRHAMAVIQGNVRIKTGVKTKNAQFPKKFHIAMSVMKNAEKDYLFPSISVQSGSHL